MQCILNIVINDSLLYPLFSGHNVVVVTCSVSATWRRSIGLEELFGHWSWAAEGRRVGCRCCSGHNSLSRSSAASTCWSRRVCPHAMSFHQL